VILNSQRLVLQDRCATRAVAAAGVNHPCPIGLCWLLNIRGSDIARNPALSSTACAVAADCRSCCLFRRPAKLGGWKAHLGPHVDHFQCTRGVFWLLLADAYLVPFWPRKATCAGGLFADGFGRNKIPYVGRRPPCRLPKGPARNDGP